MDDIQSVLKNQQLELLKIIRRARYWANRKGSGKIRIERHKCGAPQYYLVTDPMKPRGIYIRKCNFDVARNLAQKDYGKKLLAAAQKKLDILDEFMKAYSVLNLDSIYLKMNKSRQDIIVPFELTNEDYAGQWQAEEYPPYVYKGESDYASNEADAAAAKAGIFTEKNERVRSKSEKIIADKFFMMDIPYHYEKPLTLRGFGVVHPDFCVLNKRTRKEFWWEHLGMMDNPEYCTNAIRKIHAYEKNGFRHGENLIITYESRENILDSKHIEMLISQYLT